jgi:hypothetical protein
MKVQLVKKCIQNTLSPAYPVLRNRIIPLETIFAHLAILENQRSGCEQESIYWQEWQVYFKKQHQGPW